MQNLSLFAFPLSLIFTLYPSVSLPFLAFFFLLLFYRPVFYSHRCWSQRRQKKKKKTRKREKERLPAGRTRSVTSNKRSFFIVCVCVFAPARLPQQSCRNFWRFSHVSSSEMKAKRGKKKKRIAAVDRVKPKVRWREHRRRKRSAACVPLL